MFKVVFPIQVEILPDGNSWITNRWISMQVPTAQLKQIVAKMKWWERKRYPVEEGWYYL